MQKLPLTMAAPDMVLGRDIYRDDNPGGPPICGRGMRLTVTLIERLKKMGVQSITVEGNPTGISGSKNREETMKALDERFRKVEGDPLTVKLKNIYLQYYAKTYGE
ncbi:MAG TPA: hypothetical protein VMC44_01670 [Geobacteraceae bacterium]|nr:hypothetical protein [Geobacteraceae bacterium]